MDDAALKSLKRRSKHYLTESSETLSPNEVGSMLGITGEAVKQWIYTQKLSAVRLANGYWRISRSDLQQFLNSRNRAALPRLLAFVRDKVWEILQSPEMQESYCTLRANNYADSILKTSSWKPKIMIVDVDEYAQDGWRALRHKVRAEQFLVVTSKLQDDEIILKLVECGVSASLPPSASVNDFVTQCRTLWNDKAR